MSTVKCYIHAQWVPWNKKWEYTCWMADMSSSGYILLETRELEFESPSDQMLKGQLIRILRDKKKEVQAEAQVKLDAIDAEIQNLLALEDLSGREKT